MRQQARALARIQVHRWIERVGAQPAVGRVMKSGAGKALKDVREGVAADVHELY